MTLGGQGAELGPGMPDLPGRPPGWRQRGCRRRPRTGRTARSRRSATRRPPQAGLVRSRHGGLLRPALRTGASCFPGRGPRTRAGTARVVLQGQRAGPAGPAPVQRVGGEVEEHLAGEGVISRVQGASSLTSSKMSALRASPSSRTRRAVTVSSGVGRFLAGISRRYGRITDRRAAFHRAMAPARRDFRTCRHSTSTLDKPYWAPDQLMPHEAGMEPEPRPARLLRRIATR